MNLPRIRGDYADHMAEGYVKYVLGGLQASGGLMLPPDYKRRLFRRVCRHVAKLEAELGRSLPRANDALRRIQDDPWTQIKKVTR